MEIYVRWPSEGRPPDTVYGRMENGILIIEGEKISTGQIALEQMQLVKATPAEVKALEAAGYAFPKSKPFTSDDGPEPTPPTPKTKKQRLQRASKRKKKAKAKVS